MVSTVVLKHGADQKRFISRLSVPCACSLDVFSKLRKLLLQSPLCRMLTSQSESRFGVLSRNGGSGILLKLLAIPGHQHHEPGARKE